MEWITGMRQIIKKERSISVVIEWMKRNSKYSVYWIRTEAE
ncbi:hypothetical protein [Bacillus albus]|nr:hypothetical protein [Bacillus albus]